MLEHAESFASVIAALASAAGLWFVAMGLSSSREAVDMARRANELTETSFRIGQRAYVLLEGAKLREAPRAGGQPRAFATLRNTGQTPALKVRLYSALSISATGPPTLEGVDVDSLNQSTTFMGAGQTRELYNFGGFAGPLTATEADDLAMRRSWLYVVTRIEYDDVFGQHHVTDSCYFFFPSDADLGLSSCAAGNTLQ